MTRPLTRRALLRDLGRAGVAVAVLGACASDTATPTDGAAPTSTGGTAWARVVTPAVSTFFLVRGGEAALVDTGLPGTLPDVEGVLDELGLDWRAVGNIILTHHHGDHAGNIDEVAGLAPDAAVHIGAPDLDRVPTSVPLRPVEDGDRVFDLEVVATPGHTPGHVSIWDEAAGILVAGDALNTRNGTLNSASADTRFTDDGPLADQSVQRLATLGFEVLLVGHGDPITTAADTAVQDLATILG